MLIREAEFVVFDLETTGLSPEEGHRICEIGAVKVKRTEFVSSFNLLVNPRVEIPAEVVAIHKISNEEVKDAPVFEEVIDSFLDFIGDLPLLAYNLEFDAGFLNFQLKEIKKEPLKNPLLDILSICRRILSNLSRFSLGYVASFLQIEGEFHRAYKDAEIAARVFLRLLPCLEEKGISTLEDLWLLFGESPELEAEINTPKKAIIKKALEEGLRLKIKYYSLYKNEVTERQIIPLRIEERGDKSFLVGKCLLRGQERSFNLNGLINLEIIQD